MNSDENKKMIRQGIAIAGSLVLLWLIYFGSYLPWQKSKVFISTLQAMGDMRSIQEVKDSFDIPFSIPSPIGGEEVVRHFSSVILSTVQRFTPAQASATVELVRYVEENFQPIVQDQRGMSFDQNLFVLGSLNEVAFVQTRDVQYLEAAKKYFLLGHELAPKRPQFMYGLFDLYRLEGNSEKTAEIANQILSLWPNDVKTKQLFEDFITKHPIPATTTKKTK